MSESTATDATTTTEQATAGAAPAETAANTSTASTAQTEEGKAAATTEQVATGAPESYAFKLPESGLLTQSVADSFGAVAKQLNLPQEGAQQVLDALAPAIQKAQTDHLKQASESWAAAVSADPVIGKPEEQAIAKKAVDAFATPELKTLLNESGMGNHPEVVKLFHAIGKAISEDKFVGGRGASAPSDPAKRLFPTMN